MFAVAEPGRQRINFGHTLRNRGDRFINNGVARWLDNFEIRNATVFFDPQLYQHGNFGAGSETRARLNPLAVEAIVQHASVPAEFRCPARPTGAPTPSV